MNKLLGIVLSLGASLFATSLVGKAEAGPATPEEDREFFQELLAAGFKVTFGTVEGLIARTDDLTLKLTQDGVNLVLDYSPLNVKNFRCSFSISDNAAMFVGESKDQETCQEATQGSLVAMIRLLEKLQNLGQQIKILKF